jgi:hypothetical protein
MRGAVFLGLAGLLTLGTLCLAGPASARLARDAKPGGRSGALPETGGHRLLPSGPFRLECSQFGQTIIAGQGLARLSTPFPLFGWLSFQRPGGGRVMVLPLGDGATTCVVSQ